jgi:hypothetical protein
VATTNQALRILTQHNVHFIFVAISQPSEAVRLTDREAINVPLIRRNKR